MLTGEVHEALCSTIPFLVAPPSGAGYNQQLLYIHDIIYDITYDITYDIIYDIIYDKIYDIRYIYIYMYLMRIYLIDL